MQRTLIVSVFALIVSAFAIPALAQEAGSIQGLITDPQHAAIPGVKVTIEQAGTGISRSTATNYDGLYYFPSLVVAWKWGSACNRT